MADTKKSAFPITAPLLTHFVDFFTPAVGNYRNTFEQLLNLFKSNTTGSDLKAAHDPVNYSVAGGADATISDHLASIDSLFDVIDGGSYPVS